MPVAEGESTDSDVERKNIKLQPATWRAFKDTKPFSSMSHDEWVRDLLETYSQSERAP